MIGNIVQGIGNVYEKLAELFNGVRHLFDDINLTSIWANYLPADIMAVITVLFALLVILCIVGIIKRLLVVFG